MRLSLGSSSTRPGERTGSLYLTIGRGFFANLEACLLHNVVSSAVELSIIAQMNVLGLVCLSFAEGIVERAPSTSLLLR